jgi:hypothetical protein
MTENEITKLTGTQKIHVDYSKVLLTKKGGWTLEELETKFLCPHLMAQR